METLIQKEVTRHDEYGHEVEWLLTYEVVSDSTDSHTRQEKVWIVKNGHNKWDCFKLDLSDNRVYTWEGLDTNGHDIWKETVYMVASHGLYGKLELDAEEYNIDTSKKEVTDEEAREGVSKIMAAWSKK